MGLTTYLKQWIDDPTTPGERVCFKKPSWMDKEEALRERQQTLYRNLRDTREVIGKEILDEFRAESERQSAETETAVVKARTTAEVLAEYDQLVLLRSGIAGWTYCQPMVDAQGELVLDDDGYPVRDAGKPIPVTIEAIKALEPETAQWIGLTLIALIQSGFRPVMPEVVRDGNIIEVRPGVDSDPLGQSSNFTSTWQERARMGESTALPLSTSFRAS